MDNKDIQLVTNPNEVGQLLGPDAAAIDPTLAQTLAQIEADKAKKAEDQAKLDQLREQAKPKSQPLQLTYKWIGTHDCGTEPKTLVVETGDGCYATAYCIKCDIQVKSLRVARLGQFIFDKETGIKEDDILPEVKEKKK